MPHDHHKQCLDDSIVVDTSNEPSPGLAAVVDTAGTMSATPPPVHQGFASALFTSCSSDSSLLTCILHSATD